MAKKTSAALAIILIVLGAYLPQLAVARVPSQYTTILEVDIVDVHITTSSSLALLIHPFQVPVGTPFRILFHAIYPSGEPVLNLDPMQASFTFSNSTGIFATLTDVPVQGVPNQPGNYTYDTTVTSNFPTGPVTLSVLANSLHDSAGNIGPPGTVDSTITLNPYDNSTLQIGQPPTPPQPNYIVPAIIAVLIILALLLFLLARRRQKKKK